jgi:hypothetical protein
MPGLDGETQLQVYVPVALFDAIVDLCAVNRRPMKDEVIHALERHAANPPDVPSRIVPGKRPRKRGKS